MLNHPPMCRRVLEALKAGERTFDQLAAELCVSDCALRRAISLLRTEGSVKAIRIPREHKPGNRPLLFSLAIPELIPIGRVACSTAGAAARRISEALVGQLEVALFIDLEGQGSMACASHADYAAVLQRNNANLVGAYRSKHAHPLSLADLGADIRNRLAEISRSAYVR